MKKLELYVCEYCGTQYKVKRDCVQCEKEHKLPVGVVSSKYQSYRADHSGYPTRIVVEMNDGETVEYHR